MKFLYGKDNREFHCPDIDKEVQFGSKLVFAGEYLADDMPALEKPVVLDIGANMGAYACWACLKWPGCTVYSFEPVPNNFEYLKTNTVGLSVTHIAAAVSSQHGTAKMYCGKHNCGECSIHDVGEQRLDVTIEVGLYPTSLLPKADVVKVDTEGCEVDILSTYKHLHTARIVAFEWHRSTDKPILEELMTKNDFKLLKDASRHKERGVLIYGK